jgi:hypothetical protein
MAVVSTKEIHDGRDGEWSSESNRSVRRYTRIYRVKTDENTDEHVTVVAGCPQIGDVYPYDANARCRRVHASNAAFSKLVWIVTCDYSTGPEIEASPLDDPAEIEWSTDQYQKIFVKDIDGDWICTTAGELFDPPPEGDDSRWTVRVRKNLAAVPAWVLQYRNAVNSTSFTIDGISVAARCAKMSALRISSVQQRNDIAFRILEMAIHVNEETWDKEIENCGFFEVSSGSGETRRHIMVWDASNSKWVKTPKPWPIDESGVAIANPTPTNIVFNRYRIYPEKNFNSLPLT